MKTVVAEEATPPRSESVKITALVFAGILIVMVIGQLFSFEKFIPLIGDYMLPGGERTATIMASLIVISEVLALPFLLRMRLSRLMRWVSLSFSVVSVIIWLLLGLTVLVGNVDLSNSGLIGTKVAIPSGLTQALITSILTTLAVLSIWGLWPRNRK
jgi:hypothetical protein